MSVFRRVIRRTVPLAIRVQVAAGRRKLRDRRAGILFARTRKGGDAFVHEFAGYRRDFIDYQGQEHLALAKRRNQTVLARFLDGVVVNPGETYAVWTLAPRPSSTDGYASAAALKGGQLVQEVGGAICLLSTALYNAALLSDMQIVERWCHSIDSYGEARYFELGRDAAIEYGYRDLRFKNGHGHPVVVRVRTDEAGVFAAVYAPERRLFDVDFTIAPASAPVGGHPGAFAVSTVRTTTWADGHIECDDLGLSVYRLPCA